MCKLDSWKILLNLLSSMTTKYSDHSTKFFWWQEGLNKRPQQWKLIFAAGKQNKWEQFHFYSFSSGARETLVVGVLV